MTAINCLSLPLYSCSSHFVTVSQVPPPVLYSFYMYVFEHEIGQKIVHNGCGKMSTRDNRAQFLVYGTNTRDNV